MRLPLSASCLFTPVFTFQVLSFLCTMSGGKLVKHLQVQTSHDLFDRLSFICSEYNPMRSATFRYIKLVQDNGTGHKMVWATLDEKGQPKPTQAFRDTMDSLSFSVGGDFREDFHQLQVILYKPTTDLLMRSYGQFSCVASYHEEEEEFNVGPPLNLVPGTTLPVGGSGFMIHQNHTVDLVCQATLSTVITISLSDNTVVASWRANKAPFCLKSLKVACGDLRCINETCFGKVRLFVDELNRGEKYKCHVEGLNEEASQVIDLAPGSQEPESSDSCIIPCTLASLGSFMLGVFCLLGILWCNHRTKKKSGKHNLNYFDSQ